MITISGVIHYVQAYGVEKTEGTKVLSGDEQTSLLFLERDILSSHDLLECSENYQEVLSKLEQESSISAQKINTGQISDDLLFGLSLKTLKQPMAINGTITHLSDQGNPYYQTPDRSRLLEKYRLVTLGSKEVQARLTYADNEQKCFLNLVYCSDRCKDHDDQFQLYAQIPVLGISQKHQAIIIDPDALGQPLESQINKFRENPHFPKKTSLNYGIKVKDSRLSLTDFSQSTLVFDITSKLDWPNSPPFPEMTSRWFIKFGLISLEEGFIIRPPVEGIKHNSARNFRDVPVILRRRISQSNGHTQPVHFYVKNAPKERQESTAQGFEYWNSIAIDVINSPIFSYKFIEGDYDGQQEIITGDIRYNVLEWSSQPLAVNAFTQTIFNGNIGEIWSSNIFIPGPRLVEEYQRWFRYSEMIRANKPIEDSPLSENDYDIFQLVSQVLVGRMPHLQVIALAPADETFESYISGFLSLLVSHELGHALGFAHNYKASIFAQDGFIGNSVMDLYGYLDRHKTTLGSYDRMAIAYSYLGILPDNKDMSCGYENLINDHFHPDSHPECSNIDNSSDPLANFALELQQVFDLLTRRRDTQSYPYLIWNSKVRHYTQDIIFSILFYYSQADHHYNTLQTILIEGRRAESPQEVKDRVTMLIDEMRDMLCDPSVTHFLRPTTQPTNYSDYLIRRNITSFRNVINNYLSRTNIPLIRCLPQP